MRNSLGGSPRPPPYSRQHRGSCTDCARNRSSACTRSRRTRWCPPCICGTEVYRSVMAALPGGLVHRTQENSDRLHLIRTPLLAETILCLHISIIASCSGVSIVRAEVWAPLDRQKIHRVTARTVSHGELSAPAVLAHARLTIVSSDSHRLHEELITAGGIIREGRLER